MATTEVKEETTTTKKTGWQEHATGQRDATNKLITDQADKSIERVNTVTDESIAQAETDTAKAIDETTDDYVDILRSAGIQKELDLRDIRETRANMGLSRSGISATEQTAAILSAGNKTAEAQRNRQKAIDSLNDGLAKYKREAESNRDAEILEIEQQRDTDILNNNQQWDNWLFNKNEENDTNLINAVVSGDINEDTYQEAINKGWTAGEAIISYLPTKKAKSEEESKNSILMTWVQENYISPELYQKAKNEGLSLDEVMLLAEQENDKKAADEMYKSTVFGFWQSGVFSKEQYDEIMAKRPPLDDVISLAMQQSEKNAEAAAKIEAQQKGIEAKQTRVKGLYEAFENNVINDTTLRYAISNNLTLQEAIQYENENKEWDEAVENGSITQAQATAARKAGKSVDYAIAKAGAEKIRIGQGDGAAEAYLCNNKNIDHNEYAQIVIELKLDIQKK